MSILSLGADVGFTEDVGLKDNLKSQLWKESTGVEGLSPEKDARILQTVKKAARKFKRCLVARDLLRRGKDSIIALPHDKAKQFIARLNPLIESDNRVARSRSHNVDDHPLDRVRQNQTGKITNVVDKIFAERWEFQSSLVPLCVAIEDRGLPTIKMVPLSEVESSANMTRLPNGNIYVKQKVLAQLNGQRSGVCRFFRCGKCKRPQNFPKTKKELDAFVRTLVKETRNAVPWEYTKLGCEQRAQYVLDYLQLRGFPKDKMARRLSTVPFEYRIQKWDFHVAAVVLIDKEWRVIDPVLFAPGEEPHSLSTKEWIDRQKNNPDLRIVDWGFSEQEMDWNFETECNTSLSREITTDKGLLDDNLRIMGDYRGRLEASHFRKGIKIYR